MAENFNFKLLDFSVNSKEKVVTLLYIQQYESFIYNSLFDSSCCIIAFPVTVITLQFIFDTSDNSKNLHHCNTEK